jgi:hypothetical protein
LDARLFGGCGKPAGGESSFTYEASLICRLFGCRRCVAIHARGPGVRAVIHDRDEAFGIESDLDIPAATNDYAPMNFSMFQ